MSDETTVGSIIGYLRLDTSDFTRGINEAQRQANSLGRQSPDVRISTNASQVIGQLALVRAAEDGVGSSANKAKPFVVNLWAALAAVAPAAVPIAGVATGALLGLIPVAATAALGVKGITNEYKSGALQASQYGGDIKQLTGELTTLEGLAAGGILSGFDRALQSSHQLFPIINADVHTMSAQMGDIIGSAGPALVAIFTDLNPLFETFGTLLDNGAHHLEAWEQSSTGVQSFVAYVQAELPEVMQFLGQVVTLFSHLAQGAAPFGGVLLTDMTLFIHVLNAIPIGVLQAAIPLAVALYAAFKTYQGITAIISGVNLAIIAMQAPFVASAAVAQASALATEAALAEEASLFAQAKAAEAAAAADAAVAIADAVAGTSSVLAAGADEAAIAALDFATAMQTEADAAIAASAEISASATAAADAVATSGAAASAGFATMLGPIGAVVVGVALVTSLLFANRGAAQSAAAAANSYAQSVQASTDALSLANVEQTNSNLIKKGAIDQLNTLNDSNKTLGLSQDDLMLAVNGTKDQYDGLVDTLKTMTDYQGRSGDVSGATAAKWAKQAGTARSLLDTVTSLRDGLQKEILSQQQLNILNEAAAGITDRAAVAAASLYHLHGTAGVAAYLAAKKAADDNTASTKAQTLAFQLENNAAGLVNQALQTMAGQHLNDQQATTALSQATLSLASSFKTNGSSVKLNTTAGVANRQAIEGVVSAMQAKLTADAQATGSTGKATVEYGKNSKALLEQIGKLDGTKSAAYAYAKQLLAIPPVAKTKIELDAAAAKAEAAAIAKQLKELTAQRYTINVQEVLSGGVANIGNKGVQAKATGGRISGPGGPTSDSVPIMASDGEFMSTAASTSRNESALAAGNAGATLIAVKGYASGGKITTQTVGGKTVWVVNGKQYASQMAANNAAASAQAQSTKQTVSTVQTAIQAVGQAPASPQIDINSTGILLVMQQLLAAAAKLKAAIAEGLSAKQAAPLQAQIEKLTALAKRELSTLKVQIDTADLKALQASLTGTADQIETAFAKLVADAKNAGVPSAALNKLVTESNKIATELGNANAKLAADMQARADEAKSITQALNSFNIASDTPTSGVSAAITSAGLLAQAAHDAVASPLQTAAANAATLAATQLSDAQAAAKALEQALATGNQSNIAAAQAALDAASAKASTSAAEAQQAAVAASAAAAAVVASNGTGDAAAGLISDLQAQVDKATLFGQEMAQLKAEGLNDTSLQQLADAGDTDATMQRLQDLLAATPAQIQQINDLTTQLGTTASTIGDQIAGSLFDAGVNADKGLIAGLKSQEGAVAAQIKALADTMVKTLESELKIGSPSKVMRGLGLFSSQGFALGLNDGQPMTLQSAKSLANAALPKFTLARSSTASQGAGSSPELAAIRRELVNLRADLHTTSGSNADKITTDLGESLRRVGVVVTTAVASGSGKGTGLR